MLNYVITYKRKEDTDLISTFSTLATDREDAEKIFLGFAGENAILVSITDGEEYHEDTKEPENIDVSDYKAEPTPSEEVPQSDNETVQNEELIHIDEDEAQSQLDEAEANAQAESEIHQE